MKEGSAVMWRGQEKMLVVDLFLQRWEHQEEEATKTKEGAPVI